MIVYKESDDRGEYIVWDFCPDAKPAVEDNIPERIENDAPWFEPPSVEVTDEGDVVSLPG